jgi:hypothetical protein
MPSYYNKPPIQPSQSVQRPREEAHAAENKRPSRYEW